MGKRASGTALASAKALSACACGDRQRGTICAMSVALQYNLEFSAAAMPGTAASRGYLQAQRVSGPSRGSVADFAAQLRQKSFAKHLADDDLVFYHQIGDVRFQIANEELIGQLANIPIIGVDIIASAKTQEPLDAPLAATQQPKSSAAELQPKPPAAEAAPASAGVLRREEPQVPLEPNTTTISSTLGCGTKQPASYAAAAREGVLVGNTTGRPAPGLSFPTEGPSDPFPGIPRDLSLGPPKGLSHAQRIIFFRSFPENDRLSVWGSAPWCTKWQNVLMEGGRLLPDVCSDSQPYSTAAGYTCHACRVTKYMWSFADQTQQLKRGDYAVCDHCLKELLCSSCELIKHPSAFSWSQREKHCDRECNKCVRIRIEAKEAVDKASSNAARREKAAVKIQSVYRRHWAIWEAGQMRDLRDWQFQEDHKQWSIDFGNDDFVDHPLHDDDDGPHHPDNSDDTDSADSHDDSDAPDSDPKTETEGDQDASEAIVSGNINENYWYSLDETDDTHHHDDDPDDNSDVEHNYAGEGDIDLLDIEDTSDENDTDPDMNDADGDEQPTDGGVACNSHHNNTAGDANSDFLTTDGGGEARPDLLAGTLATLEPNEKQQHIVLLHSHILNCDHRGYPTVFGETTWARAGQRVRVSADWYWKLDAFGREYEPVPISAVPLEGKRTDDSALLDIYGKRCHPLQGEQFFVHYDSLQFISPEDDGHSA